MPVTKCSNGKYKIGDGECIYTTRENANAAYRAYLAEEGENESENDNAKSKNMMYNYKSLGMEVKDVDVKEGIVSGYFSGTYLTTTLLSHWGKSKSLRKMSTD